MRLTANTTVSQDARDSTPVEDISETVRRHERRRAGLGFPVAAAISAATTIGSSVLPSVLGGGQKSQWEKRRDAIQKQRRLKRKVENAETALQELRARLERKMTVSSAESILESRAETERRTWDARWRGKLSDFQNGQEIARSIANEARRIYIETANWTLLKAAAPGVLAGTSVAASAAAIGYTYYKKEISQ